MKKIYKKPVIMFEDFSLSVSIAGDCGIIIDSHASGNCGMIMGEDRVFMEGINGCDGDWGVDGVYNNICYHNPVDGNDLFNS